MLTHQDVEWIVTDGIYATGYPEAEAATGLKRILVTDAGRTLAYIVAVDEISGADGLQVIVNGEWVELGDLLPQFLGLVDAVTEMGEGEHFLEPEN